MPRPQFVTIWFHQPIASFEILSANTQKLAWMVYLPYPAANKKEEICMILGIVRHELKHA